MERIDLENKEAREYYGVPDDIAEKIISKNHSLFFSGFDNYIEQSANGETVAIFHFNEFDFYRRGLIGA